MTEIQEILSTLHAVETLEYLDQNWLGSSNSVRHEVKLKLLETAMKVSKADSERAKASEQC